jgi:Predicted transcriptional regulators
METESGGFAADPVCPCDSSCPLGMAIGLIGGRWKLRIICTLYVDGTQRYNDLLKKTAGITNTMLAVSLKELEADGIVFRTQYPEIPPRVEYALTGHGRELWPILHRLAHWAVGEDFDGDGEKSSQTDEELLYDGGIES